MGYKNESTTSVSTFNRIKINGLFHFYISIDLFSPFLIVQWWCLLNNCPNLIELSVSKPYVASDLGIRTFSLSNLHDAMLYS